MFTALTLSLALGAPVPPPTAPVATGPAPRVVELKPDANGKVTILITRTEMQRVTLGGPVPPGGGAPAVREIEVPVTKQIMAELSDVKDLTITTADGKKLDKDEALKKLEKGGIVVVSGDGNAVSPAFLKVFKDDTLVLVAKELAGPQGAVRPALRPVQINPGGVQILPIQPGVIQIQPGVIQVQPGTVQILPAAPAAPAVPVVPAVPAKPAVPVKPEK